MPPGHPLRVPKRFPVSSLVPHFSTPSLGHQLLCTSSSASWPFFTSWSLYSSELAPSPGIYLAPLVPLLAITCALSSVLLYPSAQSFLSLLLHRDPICASLQFSRSVASLCTSLAIPQRLPGRPSRPGNALGTPAPVACPLCWPPRTLCLSLP